MINESYVGKQLEALKSRVSILENQMADLLRQDETESVPDVCMTNEEAIRILKSKMDGSVDTSYEFGEAIRMAIRALEKQDVILENNKHLRNIIEVLKKRIDYLLEDRDRQILKCAEVSKIFNDKIPKMCKDCHSQSYSNGSDASYELGREDAQNSSLGDKVETVETNEQFNRMHSGYAEGWQHGYTEGYRDGYVKFRKRRGNAE